MNTDPLHYTWWLVSRAAGVTALVFVTCSVLLGLLMATKLLRGRSGLTPKLTALHEHVALAGLTAIGVHGVTLLGDGWLRPGIAGIAVPFTLHYRPFFTGLGVLAGYGAALLGLSFYARRRIGARRWRSLHRFTVVVYGLSLVHVLGAGTDAGSPVLKTFVLASAIPAALLLALRMLRRPPPPRRVPRPVSAAARS